MTYQDMLHFLRSICPAHVDVQMGEDNILCCNDQKEDSQAYVKYNEGLDISVQGVRNGNKSDTKVFSFKNENEMMALLSALVLQTLDGERRV